MSISFTEEEQQNLKCKVFKQNVVPNELNDAELPTDLHLVEYEVDGKLYVDSVRAHKLVDIFDPYYDKLQLVNGTLISITSGYGKIKPILYKNDKK
jgi:hypothetical protein